MSLAYANGGSGLTQLVASSVGGRTIRRKGYSRHSYTRKSGIKVKGSRVRSARIHDVGAPGKWASLHGPGIGPLKHGPLVAVGYTADKSKTARHTALRKAAKKYGALSTFRKVQAIGTYTKRTSKGKSKKYLADSKWVRKTLM